MFVFYALCVSHTNDIHAFRAKNFANGCKTTTDDDDDRKSVYKPNDARPAQQKHEFTKKKGKYLLVSPGPK